MAGRTAVEDGVAEVAEVAAVAIAIVAALNRYQQSHLLLRL